MTKRNRAIFLAAFLVCNGFVIADEWDQAYDDAKAILADNPELAEQKLLIALRTESKSSKNKRISGGFTIEYYPHYYLAKAYYKQGKFEQAIETARKVMQSGIFSSRNALFIDMQIIEKDSIEALRSKSNPTRTATVVPEQSKNMEFEPVMNNLQKAFDSGDWYQASSFVEEALNIKPSDPKLLKMKNEISLQKQKFEEKETKALTAFYDGDYIEAVSLWQELSQLPTQSADVYFYLGCSQASLGFLKSPEGDTELLAKASNSFKRSKQLNVKLNYDRQNISNKIIKIYRETQLK